MGLVWAFALVWYTCGNLCRSGRESPVRVHMGGVNYTYCSRDGGGSSCVPVQCSRWRGRWGVVQCSRG